MKLIIGSGDELGELAKWLRSHHADEEGIPPSTMMAAATWLDDIIEENSRVAHEQRHGHAAAPEPVVIPDEHLAALERAIEDWADEVLAAHREEFETVTSDE
jgi:hypothetical protein